ncbi:MAG: TIGR02281 family clan AA aspartic protease [Parasphingopyxis sp.]|nr:TIGR02281 family clan AA aspartic protease [Sphingomonadales bacterium]
MNGETGVDLIWAAGALVLVVAALAAHRVPLGQAAKMALAWIAIFAVGFVAFTFRDDLSTAAGRVWAELDPDATMVEGETVRIRMGQDGHFWANVSINGNQERFLIDSGATITGLSVGAAARSGVEPSSGFPMMLNTANGTIAADRAEIETLQIGSITMRDHGAVIAEEFGGTNVIGMNFLSRLSSWSVEGGWLILRP